MSQDNQQSTTNIFQLFKQAVTGKDQDFTSGSLRKAIFLLSIPMILEMLMESIFALVDIIYVSQVSVNAVATIGLTESVITLVYAVAIGLSMAATAVVARRIGEKDIKGASQAAVQVIILGSLPTVGVGLLVGLIIAIIQAVTQIQEQTLSFAPKLVAVLLTLALTFSFMFRIIMELATQLWVNIPIYSKF